MLAEWADEIRWQLIAFIDVAANFADKTFFAIGLWFGFHILLIKGIGHGFHFGKHPGFRDAADEHAVSTQIHILFHLEGDEGIHPLREIDQSIGRPEGLQTVKFICVAAAVEAETLKGAECCLSGEAVQICLMIWWE